MQNHIKDFGRFGLNEAKAKKGSNEEVDREKIVGLMVGGRLQRLLHRGAR